MSSLDKVTYKKRGGYKGRKVSENHTALQGKQGQILWGVFSVQCALIVGMQPFNQEVDPCFTTTHYALSAILMRIS